MKPDLAMRQQALPALGPGTIDRRIRAFLDGKSHGEDVLEALYGDVADEAVPDRLRALLRH